jgi:hypothetical protein
MLRFPSTHAYFQFAGYPGYFEQMSGVLYFMEIKKALAQRFPRLPPLS